jgi:hypothetical protein
MLIKETNADAEEDDEDVEEEEDDDEDDDDGDDDNDDDDVAMYMSCLAPVVKKISRHESKPA